MKNLFAIIFKMDTSLLKIGSLNTHGIKGNLYYVEKICSTNNLDLIFICEHWLNTGYNNIINVSNYNVDIHSSMDNLNHTGRPYGGLMYVSKKNIKILSCEFLNDNVSILKIIKKGIEICIIGIYLTFNNSTKKNFLEFQAQLQLVKQLCDENPYHIIIGDFNTDLKKKNNNYSKLLNEFLNDTSGTLVSKDMSTIDYTYMNSNKRSFIDHAIIGNQLLNNCNSHKFQVYHDTDNCSDHAFIELSLEINNSIPFSPKPVLSENNITPYIFNWKNKKKCIQYNNMVSYHLSKINLNLELLKTDYNSNKYLIDDFYNNICKIILYAYTKIATNHENIDKSKKCNWWSYELSQLKKLKNEAKMAYMTNNSPDDLIRVKKYKSHFRKLQRKNMSLYQDNKFKKIDNLINCGNHNEFWKKLATFKNDKNKDKLSCDEINELLKLYQNIFYKEYNLSQEQWQIKNSVISYEKECHKAYNHMEIGMVTENEVFECINQMKSTNSCGFDGLSSNMLKNASSNILCQQLCILLNAILTYKHIPSNFNTTIIVPLIKNKTIKKFLASNFRPLSISNPFAQIFERIILDRSPLLLETDSNQFGYKKGSGISTIQPLYILKELIALHKDKMTPFYIASLDAEKAFDTVWRDGLYHKIKCKMKASTWLILKLYYDTSVGFLKTNGKIMNNKIYINRGVKQGGILSPFLFNNFIDDLLLQIKKTGIGTYWLNICVAILAYCDDILLMCSSMKQLQSLLDICTDYAKSWDLKFNESKCVVLNAGHKIYNNNNVLLHINNIKMNCVNEIKYLGLVFHQDNDFNNLILKKFCTVEKSFYALNEFGIKPSGINPLAKAFVYKNFCLSKITYALGLTLLSKKTITILNTRQNNLIRYSLGLNWKSHINIVSSAMEIGSIEEIYNFNLCLIAKLLHRHEISKKILTDTTDGIVAYKNSFISGIEKLAQIEGKDKTLFIYYPDRYMIECKKRIKNKVLNVEVANICKILENYNQKNKMQLKQITSRHLETAIE
jgi:hypothetical protein